MGHQLARCPGHAGHELPSGGRGRGEPGSERQREGLHPRPGPCQGGPDDRGEPGRERQREVGAERDDHPVGDRTQHGVRVSQQRVRGHPPVLKGTAMKKFRREEGFAMITAILVSLVVLSLSRVVINLAVHNSSQSAFDLDRVMAIQAAEAGLDNYLSLLATNPNPPCSPGQPGTSLDVGGIPVEHYDVSVLFYDTWPPTGPGQCPYVGGGTPAGALVKAKGTTLSAAT